MVDEFCYYILPANSIVESSGLKIRRKRRIINSCLKWVMCDNPVHARRSAHQYPSFVFLNAPTCNRSKFQKLNFSRNANSVRQLCYLVCYHRCERCSVCSRIHVFVRQKFRETKDWPVRRWIQNASVVCSGILKGEGRLKKYENLLKLDKHVHKRLFFTSNRREINCMWINTYWETHQDFLRTI